jgi:CBS domain-containing protein
MTAAIVKNQEQDKPVHTWALPTLKDLDVYRPDALKVEEFMVTDLYTVQKDDIVELVAQLMDWNRIRYMPVEDENNQLVGLITSRLLLRHFSQQQLTDTKKENCAVHQIMIKDPISVTPDESIMEAMELMQEKKIGCLPVVKDKTSNELVGIITEMDFLRITSRLLKRAETKG